MSKKKHDEDLDALVEKDIESATQQALDAMAKETPPETPAAMRAAEGPKNELADTFPTEDRRRLLDVRRRLHEAEVYLRSGGDMNMLSFVRSLRDAAGTD